MASKDLFSCVHTEDYLNKFISGRINEEQRRTGFPWSEGIVRCCRYETGGTVLSAQVALQRGLACSTAGGTHHAFPSYGSGFCLLNHVAVAAKYLMSNSASKRRILIMDLDVHLGDGTAFIFRGAICVYVLSALWEKFPPPQTAERPRLEAHLPWLLDTFHPDLVLYDAGVDPHWEDELGKLSLTDHVVVACGNLVGTQVSMGWIRSRRVSLLLKSTERLHKRDLYVMKAPVSRRIPVATVIRGGYSRDMDKLALRHSIGHRAATQVWREM